MNNTVEDKAKAFFSKKDFDFSTPAGWRDFLSERAVYAPHDRLDDGIQLRDFKNYDVMHAQYFATGSIDCKIIVDKITQGSLVKPPGRLYVLSKDASWKDNVESFVIGQSYGPEFFNFTLGGSVPSGQREYWGEIYAIAISENIKLPPVPGLSILKRGLSASGVGYRIVIVVGNQTSPSFPSLPQNGFDFEKALKMAKEAGIGD